LSTGLRINTGADDPAGLIASESLRSEINNTNTAISNTRRASQIIATADSALGQVSSLLNDIRGLITEAANTGALSPDEIAANQLQIDSSLEAINRLAQTTTFQGRRLLDGTLEFVTDISKVPSVVDAQIDQANLGATGAIHVDVDVISAATRAELTNAGFSPAAKASAQVAFTPSDLLAVDGGGTIRVAASTNNDAADGVNVVFERDVSLINNTVAVSFNETTKTIHVRGRGDVSTAVVSAAINALDGFDAQAMTPGTARFSTRYSPPSTLGTLARDQLTIQAVDKGSDFNNVAVKFVAAASNGAVYDADQKVLTVTVNSAAPQRVSDLASAINATGLFTANATLNGSGLIDINGSDASVAGNTGNSGGEVLTGDLVFQLGGFSGSETFNFRSGASADQIAQAVNLVSDATGVAALSDDGNLTFQGTIYGKSSLVAIDVLSEDDGGTFGNNLSELRSVGSDIHALVNGIEATGMGNTFSINTSALDLSISVAPGSDADFNFNITGGGALFQLGPDVVSNQQARLGISSINTTRLGGIYGKLYELGSGQAKSLENDVGGAANVVDEVINKITSLRGRLGAFQRTTLASNEAVLSDTVANLTEAESMIRDADFAAETARLTRAQILVQAGNSVLALANQNPQNVLALLR
jgi:flagellin